MVRIFVSLPSVCVLSHVFVVHLLAPVLSQNEIKILLHFPCVSWSQQVLIGLSGGTVYIHRKVQQQLTDTDCRYRLPDLTG